MLEWAMKKMKVDQNHDYFARADLSAYQNQWVAISGKKVVAHGNNVKIVYEAARKKKPRAEISLAKVLSEKPLILSFMNG